MIEMLEKQGRENARYGSVRLADGKRKQDLYFRVQPTGYSDEETLDRQSENGGHDGSGEDCEGLACSESPEQMLEYLERIDVRDEDECEILFFAGEFLTDLGDGCDVAPSEILERMPVATFRAWAEEQE